ncbi:hypothetical protein HON22_00430, partial [Candidatus Peregrinibacteria bacterium]|nr:hypothetical protein [Candidatus Peregrinibacteria bacterium]
MFKTLSSLLAFVLILSASSLPVQAKSSQENISCSITESSELEGLDISGLKKIERKCRTKFSFQEKLDLATVITKKYEEQNKKLLLK